MTMDQRSSVNEITAKRYTWNVYFELLSKYIIFKIINDESDMSSNESKDSSDDVIYLMWSRGQTIIQT